MWWSKNSTISPLKETEERYKSVLKTRQCNFAELESALLATFVHTYKECDFFPIAFNVIKQKQRTKGSANKVKEWTVMDTSGWKISVSHINTTTYR